MRAKSGFTLVEILIVVVILGILAAIVIPQFTEASDDAKQSSLTSDLQTVRAQIELYKIQHKNKFPGSTTGVSVAEALTKYTNVDGTVATTQAPGTGIYGPYLQQIPENPFATANKNGIDPVTANPTTGDGDPGWFFNTVTGAFGANTAGDETK